MDVSYGAPRGERAIEPIKRFLSRLTATGVEDLVTLSNLGMMSLGSGLPARSLSGFKGSTFTSRIDVSAAPCASSVSSTPSEPPASAVLIGSASAVRKPTI